jgi:hypothetical protein
MRILSSRATSGFARMLRPKLAAAAAIQCGEVGWACTSGVRPEGAQLFLAGWRNICRKAASTLAEVPL